MNMKKRLRLALMVMLAQGILLTACSSSNEKPAAGSDSQQTEKKGAGSG
ncbi:hypothetical protein ACVNS2_09080 [Paenibacillus caseinilyticus]|uniref:ABC transporter substrate-binding protein n=1 Tax=Paenibacillus mucilaginosus K02 TaxID=997761 RepID=I0BEJ6_9BACL|nr:hypothetical protein [Paenibacillus mucilaginosus]AFH60793.1 hypothetical protein B2K_08695 [Paenibacillus mucilaginosus K02]